MRQHGPCALQLGKGTQLAPLKGKVRFFEQEIALDKVVTGYIMSAPDQLQEKPLGVHVFLFFFFLFLKIMLIKNYNS